MSMRGGYIDTSLANNIAHVRPFLGVLLVGSMALGVMFTLLEATEQLTQTVYSASPQGVEGTLTLAHRGAVRYADTISYDAYVAGVRGGTSRAYITTACFQEDTMVYQKSSSLNTPVYLYDQKGDSPRWDGQPALCYATLMYREGHTPTSSVYLIDAIGFEVNARPY